MNVDQHEGQYEHLAPLGSVFEDARGRIQNILSDDRVNHIALVTCHSGSVRGNHYHPTDHQYIYVLDGLLTSYSVPVGGKPTDVRRTTATGGELLYCPPMVAHAYHFLTDTRFLNIDCDPRDPEKYTEHTIPYEVFKS